MVVISPVPRRMFECAREAYRASSGSPCALLVQVVFIGEKLLRVKYYAPE